MKMIHALRTTLVIAITALFMACGTQHKGSASDRTGTNGATNGNGKTPSGPSHTFND